MQDLKWTTPALLDFDEIQNHIARDNPQASKRIAIRVTETAEALRLHPFSGRIWRSALRIRVVSGTPYLIVYRVPAAVEILRLWHNRRNWMSLQTE